MTPKRKSTVRKQTATPGKDVELGIPAKAVQVLIVDDHSFVRGIVQQHLKSCGLERFSFSQNGDDAHQMLKRISRGRKAMLLPETAGIIHAEAGADENANFNTVHTYCVVTDFGMPRGNGLQLAKAIRCGQTGLPRNTPVILLTGYSDDYVVAAALALDVSAFVIKPVSRNMLWEKVERALKSDPPIKDIAAYTAVDIPNEDGDIVGAKPKPKMQNPEIVEDDTDTVRWIPLAAVQPGTLLAGDLYGEHGTLLLRQGTVFSECIIHKLQGVERMNGFRGKVPIKIEDVAPGAEA